MKEQLIEFETAKLAKEKGFKADGYHLPYIEKHTKESYYYEMPSQSLVQKWLREEHQIHVWVSSPTDGFYDACVVRDKTNHYRKFDDFTTNETDFTTYETALEDGLLEALKLIKQ
ncbi:MAG: hypothetical protein V4666_08270 [Bacteroidota bacterium]